MDDFENKIKIIETTNNGIKWHNAYDSIIDNIDSLESNEKKEFIETMMKYVDNGQLDFKYWLCIDAVANLIDEDDDSYAGFFHKQIFSKNGKNSYYAIAGYIKCLKKSAIPDLVKFILGENNRLESRAKAVKEISKLSNHPFDYLKPNDPGYWKTSDINKTEILNWQANGYPDGTGYPEQIRSANLDNPKNEFEKIIAKLDKKLLKKRLKNNDLSNPSNILVISNNEKFENVIKQLGLENISNDYLEFLKNYSPINVTISCKKYKNVSLFGIDELLEGQQGYSYFNDSKLETWDSNLIVIASSFGNPFCIKLDEIDSNIYFAEHGLGKWDFEIVEKSFFDFIKKLSQN